MASKGHLVRPFLKAMLLSTQDPELTILQWLLSTRVLLLSSHRQKPAMDHHGGNSILSKKHGSLRPASRRLANAEACQPSSRPVSPGPTHDPPRQHAPAVLPTRPIDSGQPGQERRRPIL